MLARALPALLLIVTPACGPTAPAPGPPQHRGGARPAPDLDGLRVLLVKYSRLEFDAAARARGCPADETLGGYVAKLVEYGSPVEDGDVHRLTGGCGAFPEEPIELDPPRDPRYWYCTIDAFMSDPSGQSPWHYELRVRIRQADDALDLQTIACPGAA